MGKFQMKGVKVKAKDGGSAHGYNDVKLEDSELEFENKSIDFIADKNEPSDTVKKSKALRFLKLISENKLLVGLILLIITIITNYFLSTD